MKTVIIKVGGSLLDLPDLQTRLRGLLNRLKNSLPLLVSGGGQAADVVRSWDQTHHLGEATAHWLAIQSLMLNDQLLCRLLPEACVVSSPAEAVQVWKEQGIPILCSYTYLQQTTSSQVEPLPTSWDVTSDSISAWVAVTWRADELIFLKSVDLPQNRTLSDLALTGLVDSFLPTLTDLLPDIYWCNLRDSHTPFQLATVTKGKSFHMRNATGPA